MEPNFDSLQANGHYSQYSSKYSLNTDIPSIGSMLEYIDTASDVKIQFLGNDGSVEVLKASTPLLAGEIIDASVLSLDKLKTFVEKEQNVHYKKTTKKG